LAEALKRGDPVTVRLWNGSIVKMEVVDPAPFWGGISARTEDLRTDVRLSPEAEGEVWCRGHEGEDYDAFMASEAMADRTQPFRTGAGAREPPVSEEWTYPRRNR